MPRELFANQPVTTVSSGGTTAPVAGTVETWTVASSASFPAAVTNISQFHVCEDDLTRQSEIVLVTNVSGTTWTVTRGAEGTTPVTHPAGFTIVPTVSAEPLKRVLQSATSPAPMFTVDSVAPSNPTAGDIWVDTSTAVPGPIGAPIPMAFHLASTITTGVKKPKFLAIVNMTISGAYAVLDTGSGTTYRVVWTTAAGVATNLATSSAVGTTSSLTTYSQNISAGDWIAIEVVAAGTAASDLSVTVNAVTR